MLFLTAVLSPVVFCLSDEFQSVSAAPMSASAKTYHNPLFEPDFPDPSFIRGRDGLFYTYSTEWNGQLTPILRSPDMIQWEFIGAAWLHKPHWKETSGLWAPQIVYNETSDNYCLYSGYSL
jgi:arabinan endo-1,5-alpha-L-arabinosidase